jgi:uncharacterized glyoxalase superfamily protein PhnB
MANLNATGIVEVPGQEGAVGRVLWGQRYAQLADPDGVPVDLYAALP